MVVLDDARTAIESTVHPGGECEVQLNVVAPAQPGDYELEIDLVQELIGWFADRGSPTLKVPVTVIVRADARASGEPLGVKRVPSEDDQADFVPQMEVHVMVQAEVVAVLEEAGGVVLDVSPKDRCGPAMRSLDYIVARAAVADARTLAKGTD